MGWQPQLKRYKFRHRQKKKTRDTKNSNRNVELCIKQFNVIAGLQNWNNQNITVKTKEGLSEKSRTYNQYNSQDEIAGSLRLHYGITLADASPKLNSLKKRVTHPFIKYMLKIWLLLEIPYEDADPR